MEIPLTLLCTSAVVVLSFVLTTSVFSQPES